MKQNYVLVFMTMIALVGCASTPSTEITMEPVCPKLETGASFSCWWSGDTAPITHCVAQVEDNPACHIKQKAGAYFDRGAYVQRVTEDQSKGTWIVIRIFEDEMGRIGQRSTNPSGEYILSDHSETPMRQDISAVTNPVWPRWPSGLEFGPN